jgi:hypothetical protein
VLVEGKTLESRDLQKAEQVSSKKSGAARMLLGLGSTSPR